MKQNLGSDGPVELDLTSGATVEVPGVVVADFGGKYAGPASLLLRDFTHLELEPALEPSQYGFVDKRVIVRGVARQSGGVGRILRVERIELAPGEVPYPEAPLAVPPAPLVRTAADLLERRGRYVQAEGILHPLLGDFGFPKVFLRGRLTFPDLTFVGVTEIPRLDERVRQLGKKPVIVVGTVRRKRHELLLHFSRACLPPAPCTEG